MSVYVVGKNPCKNCIKEGRDSSGDNFYWYGDERGGHCFSCGYTEHSEDFLEEMKESGGFKSVTITNTDRNKFNEKKFDEDTLNKVLNETSPTLDSKYRGLDKDICAQLGVRWKYDEEGKVSDMYFPARYVEDGEIKISGYKIRHKPKNFFSTGYVGKVNLLGGQTQAVADTLVVVGGEICLVSAKQMLAPIEKKYNRQINVVTSLLGEDSTADCLKAQIDWVNKHKKIILALDNDDAGKKATQKCLDFLPKDKLFTANLRYKDANDYIRNKDVESYMQDAYWNASPVESYGVKGSKELLQGAKLRLQQDKVPFPEFMSDLADHFTDRSMWIGEWVNWVSGVSSGKSTVFDAWMIDWALTSPYRQAIMSYESDWKSFGVKVASLATSRAVMKIEGKENRLKFIEENEDEILKLLQTEDGDDRFDFVDQLPKNINEAKKLITYLVKIRGVRILWIDPALDFLSLCQNKNEYDELIIFLDNIRMTEDVTIMCALHTRKQLSSGVNASEGGEIQEEDAYGGREIIAKGTLNLTAQRNKNAQDPVEKNTMVIKIRKNRNDQVTGVTTRLYYRPKANKLYPYSYAESKGFFMDDLNKSVEEINLDDAGFSLSDIGANDIDISEEEVELPDW